MVAVAFQLIVRWCWTISCERFFKACRRSQNYDVILDYSKTNQRTSCITYIHNIYLQWYLQQDPKLFFSIILMKQTAATFLVKASSLNPYLTIPSASPAPSPSPLYQSAASKVFVIASATILVHGPPSAFQQQLQQQQLQGQRQQQQRRQQQRQQQQIKHFYSGGIISSRVGVAAVCCISNATLVSACVIDISDRPSPFQLHTLP